MQKGENDFFFDSRILSTQKKRVNFRPHHLMCAKVFFAIKITEKNTHNHCQYRKEEEEKLPN
jgi:hypothetical protein